MHNKFRVDVRCGSLGIPVQKQKYVQDISLSEMHYEALEHAYLM